MNKKGISRVQFGLIWLMWFGFLLVWLKLALNLNPALTSYVLELQMCTITVRSMNQCQYFF